MKISVKDAFASHTYHKEYNFELTSDMLGALPEDSLCDTVKATVVISSQSGVVTCEMNVSASLKTICSRCAKEFFLPLEFSTKKLIRKQQQEDFEDVIYADNCFAVDIAEEIRTQIFFEFPTKPLCSENCKGLCPVCGCDLNVKSCSCDIKTVDPRLEILKKLIDK